MLAAKAQARFFGNSCFCFLARGSNGPLAVPMHPEGGSISEKHPPKGTSPLHKEAVSPGATNRPDVPTVRQFPARHPPWFGSPRRDQGIHHRVHPLGRNSQTTHCQLVFPPRIWTGIPASTSAALGTIPSQEKRRLRGQAKASPADLPNLPRGFEGNQEFQATTRSIPLPPTPPNLRRRLPAILFGML